VPVLVIGLVNPDEHALLVLPGIGVAVEIDHHRNLEIEGRDLRHALGDEIVMLERRYWQVEPDHATDLLRPQAGGIDDVLGDDRALFADHLPAARGALLQREDAVALDHLGAAHLRTLGVGLDDACRVDIAFAIGPHAAEYPRGADDRAGRLDFIGGHEADVFD